MGDNNTRFWGVRHDWLNYKDVWSEGKILLAQDILSPGFEITPLEHWYSLARGRGEKRKIADFPAWIGGAFFVGKRGYEVLEDMLQRQGRTFPVRCDNTFYHAVIIDSKHDAVDLERSAFIRLWDDERPIENDISQIKRIILKEEFLTSDDVFRIDRGFALSQQIIVSDKFKVRYEASNLTGLLFKEAALNM